MSLFQTEYELKVSFEDLDPMNVVWHGNYMRYMEQARVDLFEKLNYSYQDICKDGVAYPVAKMTAKYIKPAVLGDYIVVKTEIISIEPSLDLKYSMFNKKTGEKIFEASTMQIGIDALTKQTRYEATKRFKEAIETVKNV